MENLNQNLQAPRYLITTSCEDTWKFDRPVIFLGEWCKLFERRYVWQKMDYQTSPPYGLESDQKLNDFHRSRDLEKKIFPDLVRVLNNHHKKDFSNRFWAILVGHWFRRTIDVLINRLSTFEKCIDLYQISGTTVHKDDNYSLATIDSQTFIWALSDPKWNSVLTGKVLRLIGSLSFPIEQIKIDLESDDIVDSFKITNNHQDRIFGKFNKFAKYLLSVIIGKVHLRERIFIHRPYLPIKEVIKLELSLGQIPKFTKTESIQAGLASDAVLRRNLTNMFIKEKTNNLEHIVRSLVFELIPICYLEGLSSLHNIVEKQSWPRKPEKIFTSNSFDTDEAFKLYTGLKTELGSRYFVGQHGNKYGTHYHFCPSLEEFFSDKFLTWGWFRDSSKQIPAFIFKNAGKSKMKNNSEGGLALIELCLNHRIATWDVTYEFKEYFEHQICFIESLNEVVRSKLTIRLHSTFSRLQWKEDLRWQDYNSRLKIDYGQGPIEHLIENSRLVVFSYDSTGLLETLSANIPTLAFWKKPFDLLDQDAAPYYKLLIKAGILHETVTSITRLINENWDNIEAWWSSPELQEARIEFCSRFAKNSSQPIKELKNILVKH